MFDNDSEADKRSLMMKQAVICNGQKTGRPCVHYTAIARRVLSANSDHLRTGEKVRLCSAFGTFLEFDFDELPVQCTSYKPRRKTLPVLLGLHPDHTKYDEGFEEYRPLTPEEIADLQPEEDEDPALPVDAGSIGALAAAKLLAEAPQKEPAVSLEAAIESLEEENDK
jgi:hypothetical protein